MDARNEMKPIQIGTKPANRSGSVQSLRGARQKPWCRNRCQAYDRNGAANDKREEFASTATDLLD